MRDAQIIVTGASRGIGAAIAAELAARGWSVAGMSRGGESAAGDGFACDMTDEAAVRATPDRERLGALLAFAVSDAHFAARRHLGVAIQQ